MLHTWGSRDGMEIFKTLEIYQNIRLQSSEIRDLGYKQSVNNLCGDGYRITGETCNDGNQENGDGCDSTCQVEEGFICCLDPTSNRYSNDNCYLATSAITNVDFGGDFCCSNWLLPQFN